MKNKAYVKQKMMEYVSSWLDKLQNDLEGIEFTAESVEGVCDIDDHNDELVEWYKRKYPDEKRAIEILTQYLNDIVNDTI